MVSNKIMAGTLGWYGIIFKSLLEKKQVNAQVNSVLKGKIQFLIAIPLQGMEIPERKIDGKSRT